jgi:tetratricopeptide (TPR) repeat protein
MMEYFFFCESVKEFKHKVPKLIPFALMMAIVPLNYITGTAAAPDAAGGLIPGNYREISHGHYLLTQFNVIRTYIRLLVFPLFQNLDYDYPVSRTLFDLPTLLSLLLLLAVLAIGIMMFKKDRLVSFGIFFFFLALSVESSIIPIWDVIFEHRLYLPFAGFAIITGRVLFTVLPNLKQFEKGGQPSPFFYGILFAIIVLIGFLTIRRNTIWQNEITLWQDVIKKSPNKARGHINLGLAFQNRGKLKEAHNAYQLALKYKPRDTDAHYNLGNLYRDIGKPDLAINEYARVIRQEPDYIKAHLNLGVVYNQQGMPDNAVEAYQKVVALNPGYGLAYYNLGNIFIRQNQFDRAISFYKKAAERMPDHPGTRNNMGVALERAGQMEAARQAYQDALRVHPGYTDALKNLEKLNRKMLVP